MAEDSAHTGSVIFVRYCDDFVIGFQYEEDARRLWADLSTRLASSA